MSSDLYHREAALEPARANGAPASFDPDRRTVELFWTVGAPVDRRGARPDGSYGLWREELEVSAAAVDLTRLKRGAPLLDSHQAYDVRSVLGVVEAAEVRRGKGWARVKLSERDDVAGIVQDIQAGVLRNISVGYEVTTWERRQGKPDEVPSFVARRWVPLELSLVAVPADAAAQTRSLPVEPPMTTAEAAAPAVTETRAASAPDAATVERERAAGILLTARKLGVPAERAEQLIADGTPLEAARSALIDMSATMHSERTVSITSGRDHTDPAALRGRLADALAHRLSHGRIELPDAAREFRGCSMLDMARVLLEARGERGILGRSDVAGALFRDLGGLHTTSDFPILLADAAGKSLMARFRELMPVLTAIARRSTTPDFKTIKRARIGEGGGLEKLMEDSEVTRGTMGEAGETYTVESWARIWGLSRPAIVNDDLGAFQDFLGNISRKAGVTLGNVLFTALNANAPMSDGIPLFATGHRNLAATLAPPTPDGMREAFISLRSQRGVDGDLIEVEPRFLVVGPAQEYAAMQLLADLRPVTSSDVNPFSGKLQLVVEPRVTDDRWYVFADPGAVPVLEFAELDGTRPMGGTGPNVTTRMGFDVQGVEVKIQYDVGAGIVSYQGAYLNPGS